MRRRAVILELLESAPCLVERWLLAGFDPPANRSGRPWHPLRRRDHLEPFGLLRAKLVVDAAVDESGKRCKIGPCAELGDEEGVLGESPL